MEAFLPDPPAVNQNGATVYTDVAEAADTYKLHAFAKITAPTGPYHLVNTNLILVDSKERNWRVRGGQLRPFAPALWEQCDRLVQYERFSRRRSDTGDSHGDFRSGGESVRGRRTLP